MAKHSEPGAEKSKAELDAESAKALEKQRDRLNAVLKPAKKAD